MQAELMEKLWREVAGRQMEPNGLLIKRLLVIKNCRRNGV